ncbi:MAG TPA: hypothetical protein VGK19_17890 [Capsulimonadaceae bacterium]|jgi:predicted RNase H-like HicB family nuclease
MRLEVRLDHDGDAWGAASESPEIYGGVVGVGRSREAAIADFLSALRFHIEGLREDGMTVPDVDGIDIREIVESRELLAA